ncbi:MAG: hypothetical protein BWK75_01055 [Candidatus Altiarchaeales archaeon A3]|nr:MAG: hypothetical protein BWK75_01055 [Candidatus Altiarchaeales archaeon A3]
MIDLKIVDVFFPFITLGSAMVFAGIAIWEKNLLAPYLAEIMIILGLFIVLAAWQIFKVNVFSPFIVLGSAIAFAGIAIREVKILTPNLSTIMIILGVVIVILAARQLLKVKPYIKNEIKLIWEDYEKNMEGEYNQHRKKIE